jgi:hypothetical protein
MKKSTKWIIGLFSFFLIFIAVLAVLPFLINLNKFKPQIQDAVSSNLNAQVDFSSAQLTILTGLGVELKDVDIENTDAQFKGTKLLHVKELDLKLELLPLLNKGFIGSIKIKSPDILILKDGEKNNIASLGKMSESKKEEEKGTKGESSNDLLSGLLIKSLSVKDANITFHDVTKGEKNKPILIHDLNLLVTDLGLDKDMKVVLSTDLSIEKDDLKLKGPLELDIVSNTHMKSSEWDSTKFQGTINFDKVKLNYKDAFVKSDKIPFHMSMQGYANTEKIEIKNLKLSLENLLAKLEILIQNKGDLNSNMNLNLSTTHIEELKQFFPKHEKLLSKGSFNLDLQAQGGLKKINSMKSKLNLKLNLLNSDLALLANTSSLQPLVSNFQADSKTLYVGEIIKPFLEKSKDGKSFDFDKVIVTNFSTNGQISDLKLALNKLNMNIFSGNISSNHINANLKDKSIPFDGNVTTKNLDVKQLIELVDKDKSSPIMGKFDLVSTFNGKGSGENASKSLNAKGNFLFHDGKMIGNRDIVGRAVDGLTETLFGFSLPPNPLAQAGDAVLKKLNISGKEQTEISNIKSDFEIRNGQLILSKMIINLLGGAVESTVKGAVEGVKDTIKDGVKDNFKGIKKIQEDPKKFLKDTFGF